MILLKTANNLLPDKARSPGAEHPRHEAPWARQPADVLPAALSGTEQKLLAVFHQAAQRVPAYRAILDEAGVSANQVDSLADFVARVPVIDKRSTFGRFGIAELCLDGRPGQLLSVLSSSGHSGVFSYGLYGAAQAQEACRRADAALDAAFAVRSRRTLLVNCLPMGVKVPTDACTVADVSVRPDMATAVVRQFSSQFEQVLLVGETAFIKRVLELGRDQGLRWSDLTVHILLGSETLAENARTYLGSFLDTDLLTPQRALVASSMGMAELGLNLLFELPVWSAHPLCDLIRLRRAFHCDQTLKAEAFGRDCRATPMVMTYDPGALFVEVLRDASLVFTPLEPDRPIPLVRYNTGDKGRFLALTAAQARDLEQAAGLQAGLLTDLPVILFYGRGEGVRCDGGLVTPEQVKEGLYADPCLAALTTCNFRLTGRANRSRVKVQLSPGVKGTRRLNARFAAAIRPYVTATVEVTCVDYAAFPDMELNFEHKFRYLDRPCGSLPVPRLAKSRRRRTQMRSP